MKIIVSCDSVIDMSVQSHIFRTVLIWEEKLQFIKDQKRKNRHISVKRLGKWATLTILVLIVDFQLWSETI